MARRRRPSAPGRRGRRSSGRTTRHQETPGAIDPDAVDLRDHPAAGGRGGPGQTGSTSSAVSQDPAELGAVGPWAEQLDDARETARSSGFQQGRQEGLAAGLEAARHKTVANQDRGHTLAPGSTLAMLAGLTLARVTAEVTARRTSWPRNWQVTDLALEIARAVLDRELVDLADDPGAEAIARCLDLVPETGSLDRPAQPRRRRGSRRGARSRRPGAGGHRRPHPPVGRRHRDGRPDHHRRPAAASRSAGSRRPCGDRRSGWPRSAPTTPGSDIGPPGGPARPVPAFSRAAPSRGGPTPTARSPDRSSGSVSRRPTIDRASRSAPATSSRSATASSNGSIGQRHQWPGCGRRGAPVLAEVVAADGQAGHRAALRRLPGPSGRRAGRAPGRSDGGPGRPPAARTGARRAGPTPRRRTRRCRSHDHRRHPQHPAAGPQPARRWPSRCRSGSGSSTPS